MSESGIPRLTTLLSAEQMALVAGVATRRSYRDGELVHERGDIDRAIGIVIAGKIKLTHPRRDGTETFSGVIHAGQNYGDAALLHGQPRPHRAVAVGETQIDHVDRAAFAELLKHPAIVHAFYLVSSFRLSVTIGLLDDMRMLSPEVRLARLIVRMREADPGSDRIEYLQEDLAGMLGVSTVTLAKALRELVRYDLVRPGYGHIRVGDPLRLAAWIDERDPG